MKLLYPTFQTLLLLSPALQGVNAWGSLGHMTVAFIASSFVQPETKIHFQNILADSSPAYLAQVATWADSYRYTAGGSWSAPLHFIDAIDKPPYSCGVNYFRDCPAEGCVVAAIQNYTNRVMDARLNASERAIAAKFVVHFIGDIHQPLHDENISRGGNGIQALYSGKVSNLHSIWDSSIPEQLVGGYSLTHAQTWAATLSAAISSGMYKPLAAGWLKGIDFSDSVGTALVWAMEANALICNVVMPDGVEALQGKELNGTYYDTAIPVVSLQVARAGYRLATWLDLIAGVGGTKVTEEL